MKVSELQDRGKVDEITLKIIEKTEPKEVRGGSLRMCNCVGEDDSGKVGVTLWAEDVDKVNEGDTIKITNGWSSEYQGNMQLSAGKFGQLEVVKE